MRPPLPCGWSCLLLLTPGLVWAAGRIQITTKVNAHYAITTVKAPFTTGSSPEDVTFEMQMVTEAFVSGFSITADGLECKATVDELYAAYDTFGEGVAAGQTAGKLILISGGPSQSFETSVRMKENSEGFFLLTFEHQVPKDDVGRQYKITIPVSTSQYYDRWSVKMDIMEDDHISTAEHDMEFDISENGNTQDLSDEFKKNVRNVGPSQKEIFFEGNLPAPADSNSYNYYSGHFSVNYTTNPGAKQMETFVSETQIGALINPNPVLNENPGLDILVLLDTSGSMVEDDKLTLTLEAVVGTILKSKGGLREEDRVTLIQFHTDVVDLGTFSGGRRDRRNARKKLREIVAAGWTDINGAIDKALDVAEKHIEEGSTDIPLIVMYTDGKPEGGRDTGIVSDTERIRDSVRRKNSRCIPIYSIAIGEGADFNFIRDISRESCGQAYDFKVGEYLIDSLEEIFEEIRVPIYSSKPEISVKSDCVDESKFHNDLTTLYGKKFANTTNFDLINIPFKTSIPITQACEVEIVYTANVANKALKEEIKLCFPQGRQARRRFQKLTDLSQDCSRRIPGPPVKIPEGNFVKRLRQYRDITEQVNDKNADRDALTERAKEANFVVDGLTALVVVVQTGSDQCEPIPPTPSYPGTELFSFAAPDLYAPAPRYSCQLEACDKSGFRGKCVTIYDEERGQLRAYDESLGPDEISSMRITEGEAEGGCPGYILYTEENFRGDSSVFPPGEYAGFREMGILYQETRSLQAQSRIRPLAEQTPDYPDYY